MLNLTRGIDSLSNFKRQTAKFLKRMKRSGEPLVLTINGKAAFVVQDAASYQRLLALSDEAESLEFLRRSLEDADAGRLLPMRAALKALGKRR